MILFSELYLDLPEMQTMSCLLMNVGQQRLKFDTFQPLAERISFYHCHYPNLSFWDAQHGLRFRTRLGPEAVEFNFSANLTEVTLERRRWSCN